MGRLSQHWVYQSVHRMVIGSQHKLEECVSASSVAGVLPLSLYCQVLNLDICCKYELWSFCISINFGFFTALRSEDDLSISFGSGAPVKTLNDC